MSEPTADAELLDELRRVRGDLTWREWVGRMVRRLAIVGVVALVAAVVSLAAVAGVLVGRHEACERDNDLRQAYIEQWQPILDQPTTDLPPNPTDQQRTQYEAMVLVRQRFQASLTGGFATHECRWFPGFG